MTEDQPAPQPSGPPDLVRFLIVALAVVIVIVTLFLFVRARQMANANHKYEQCLEQAREQDNPPGFRPEDYCQKPG